MLKHIIVGFLVINLFQVNGQVLQTSAPFSITSSMLEPDGRKLAVKISDSEFLTLSKAKGAASGPSDYILEKYDLTLKSSYKVPMVAEPQEEFKQIDFNGTEAVLFSEFHQTDKKVTRLVAYGLNPADGSKKWTKEIASYPVGTFEANKIKGAVKRDFENAVASFLSENFTSPVQYQHLISYSPDQSKALAYYYDYSQKNLVARVKVMDKSMNVLDSASISIDNNFINYGIFVNNKGDLFILNVDRFGRIVVIKYRIKDKDIKLLDLQYTSSHRESFKLKQLNDDVVYVANINTNNHKLAGVMYAKFNFETNLVEKINFHEISDGLRQTIQTIRSTSKAVANNENWLNYELTDFFLNEFEKIVIVLEKREIVSPGYQYDPAAVNDPTGAMEREGKVMSEGVLLFSFNNSDELMWENFYVKSQTGDVTAGLISSSYVIDDTNDEKLRLIFAYSDNATGVLNQVKLVEYDPLNGSKIRDMLIDNPEGMSLIRSYTLWWPEKVVLVGKKGLLGKKTVISLYKI